MHTDGMVHVASDWTRLGLFMLSSFVLNLSAVHKNAAANMTSIHCKRLPPSLSSQMFRIIHCGAAPLKDT